MSNKYFNIYPFCKIVSGKDSHIICDLQKQNIKFIPFSLVEVINLLEKEEFKTVEEQFEEQKGVFNSYINFLIKEDLGFFSDYKTPFIPIPEDYLTPDNINNAAIEIAGLENLENLFLQLDDLHCQFIELKVISTIDLEQLANKLEIIEKLQLRSLQLFIPFEKEMATSKIVKLFKKVKKAVTIAVYNCPKDWQLKGNFQVKYLKKSLEEIQKGNSTEKDLIINLSYYFLAKKYNPYYYKKIAINSKGEIKNCLKNKRSFGTIQDFKLAEVIEKSDFQELWFVNHDCIVDIKDSPLRYNRILTNDLKKVEENLYELVD
ncbi:hypothetical protein EH230_08590 [Flavobacterium columnare]|uniref:Grasp-with-spasm system SPASM domain peptide maturase n=1 Tax=Flavobacterium columnare TaxID=996 RepID=A0A437UBF9_9FLAO|nr:hypothetical protein [Flavobacterium columnare]RVU90947.1 hypothetical protein EH230_08590 [Flavobacterium columnare]